MRDEEIWLKGQVELYNRNETETLRDMLEETNKYILEHLEKNDFKICYLRRVVERNELFLQFTQTVKKKKSWFDFFRKINEK